jgi:hypothetical protein
MNITGQLSGGSIVPQVPTTQSMVVNGVQIVASVVSK